MPPEVFLPNNDITLAELAEEREASIAAMVWLARNGDANAFCELVLKDEKDGSNISQAGIHEEWHQLCDEHDRLVMWSAPEMGKSTQLSIGRTLFELGRNPNLRFAIISNTHEQAAKIVRTCARLIQQSPELRTVFPNLEADTHYPWRQNMIYVRRDSVGSKDPSIQAFGFHGNIQGSRVDRLNMDDVLDFENTRTPKARDDFWDWYHSTAVAGRLTDQAKVRVQGNAHHPDDFMHRLARNPVWHAARFPAVDSKGKSAWPEVWPIERIERKRRELGGVPHEFARQMLCQARDDDEARFKREWIDKCMARGRGLEYTEGLEGIPDGYGSFTGVDLGVGRKASNDLTCLFSMLVHPNHDREVLEVQAGRWSADEIIKRCIDTHRRYKSILWVENNGSQDFLVQFAQDEGLPVWPFTTGRNKIDPRFGVESLAAEMAAGKWIIPDLAGAKGREIEKWIEELLYYTPDSHTGDRLMASWIAKEGARRFMVTPQNDDGGATMISV